MKKFYNTYKYKDPEDMSLDELIKTQFKEADFGDNLLSLNEDIAVNLEVYDEYNLD